MYDPLKPMPKVDAGLDENEVHLLMSRDQSNGEQSRNTIIHIKLKVYTCVLIIDNILIEPCSPAKAIIGLSPNIPHADV